jgi:hypothetical protein
MILGCAAQVCWPDTLREATSSSVCQSIVQITKRVSAKYPTSP